ncbi:hypothetical protein RHGRI_035631 [Rhododendron griersonianum]|uniref:Nodulin homeobox C-terminal domain-containing protein n=1 Tax=Rhododendron griersonianum TaxID=479676 RepID=A0AAV6HNY1_9ERIC|nr:hypothetical protein RHGRI_035631 [Rhododendron griersonianum]
MKNPQPSTPIYLPTLRLQRGGWVWQVSLQNLTTASEGQERGLNWRHLKSTIRESTSRTGSKEKADIQLADFNNFPAKHCFRWGPGQDVLLLNLEGEEIGTGKVYQVRGTWGSCNLEESEMCVVDVNMIRTESCTGLPIPVGMDTKLGNGAIAAGVQGGIGPAGHSTDELYVLDLTNDKFKWHRVVVQGQGPGPRYGHVMDLVAQRYLVTVSGNDVTTPFAFFWKKNSKKKSDRRAVSPGLGLLWLTVMTIMPLVCGKKSVVGCLGPWALDTAQKPYAWQRLNPEGDRPSARMYATASARSDGMFLLCGGRDISGAPLADAYGLLMHRNGQWEWTLAPGVSPSPRYQHAVVFVGARLHVTGGALRGGRSVEGEAAIAVLDTAAGVWLDRKGLVTSSRTSKGHTDNDPSVKLMRRCRHAAASVGVRVYIYGGLKGDILLDDCLVAENSPLQSDISSPVLISDWASTSPRANYSYTPTSFLDGFPESPTFSGTSFSFVLNSVPHFII